MRTFWAKVFFFSDTLLLINKVFVCAKKLDFPFLSQIRPLRFFSGQHAFLRLEMIVKKNNSGWSFCNPGASPCFKKCIVLYFSTLIFML